MYSTLRIYEMASDWTISSPARPTRGSSLPCRRCRALSPTRPSRRARVVRLGHDVHRSRRRTASDRLAGQFVQQHVADRFPSPPEITCGEVRISAGATLSARSL